MEMIANGRKLEPLKKEELGPVIACDGEIWPPLKEDRPYTSKK